MVKRRLRIPIRLAVVVVGAALTACPGAPPSSPDLLGNDNICPPEIHCDTDAARAIACTDAGSAPNTPFISDLGSCYPPV